MKSTFVNALNYLSLLFELSLIEKGFQVKLAFWQALCHHSSYSLIVMNLIASGKLIDVVDLGDALARIFQLLLKL